MFGVDAVEEAEEGRDSMVPVSEGWPPPWGWKIVPAVMTTWCSCVPSLKRARVGSGRSAKGVLLVVVVW